MYEYFEEILSNCEQEIKEKMLENMLTIFERNFWQNL